MQAFLGIFPTKDILYDYKSFKLQLRKQKQNLRFVPAPDVHLTLKYLGPEVGERTIEELKNIIPNVLKEHKPFELSLSKIQLGFPHDKFPKVLNIMLAPSPELTQLVLDVEHALGGGRFKDLYAPKKDYIPHITIGRLHGNIHRKKIGEVNDAIERATWEGFGKVMPVTSIKLVHSDPAKDGYVYRELGEFQLTGK